MLDNEMLIHINSLYEKLTIEQLDDALLFYYNISNSQAYPLQVYEYLTKKYDIGMFHAMVINEKLVKDGFLSVEPTVATSEVVATKEKIVVNTKHYQITFDGILFYQAGGYTKQNEDREREEKFKKRLNVSNFWTPILTAIIAGLALMRTFAGCDKQIVEVNHTDKQDPAIQKLLMQKNQFQHDTLAIRIPEILIMRIDSAKTKVLR